MRRLVKILIALVVLLAIVLGVVLLSIDGFARSRVEAAATQALGVGTSVKTLTLGLFRGEVKMGGLKVENPKGFTSDHFLTLGDGDLQVTLGTLLKDKVIVSRLELKNIDVSLEKKGDKGNYDVILANLKGQDKQDKNAQPGKKFTINDISITDITVHVDALGFGGELTHLDVKIPEIKLQNVGSDSDNGVVLSQVTNVVVKAVMRAVMEKAGGILPPEILEGLGGGLAQLEGVGKFGFKTVGDLTSIGGDLTKNLGKSLNQVGEGVGKTGETVVKDAGKVFGGLLPGSKKKTDSEKNDEP